MASLVVVMHAHGLRYATAAGSGHELFCRGGAVRQHACAGLFSDTMPCGRLAMRKAVLDGSWMRFLRVADRGLSPSPVPGLQIQLQMGRHRDCVLQACQ